MKKITNVIKKIPILAVVVIATFAIPIIANAIEPPDRPPPTAASTQYLYLEKDNMTYSPVTDIYDWIATGQVIDLWVKKSGDTLLDFDGNPTGLSDPIHDFKDAQIRQFWMDYKDPSIYPAADFWRFFAIIGTAGFTAADHPLSVINDITEVIRPGYFTKENLETPDFPYETEEISLLDSQTYTVEFEVPASPTQEKLKEQVAAYSIDAYAQWLMEEAGIIFYQVASMIARNVAIAISPYLFEPAADTYKIRGWFIRGDGIESDNGRKVHPLVIVSLGHGMRIEEYQVETPSGRLVQSFWSRPMRGLAYNLVLDGYDVLFYNYEASGYSEGWNRWHDFTPAGEHEIKNIANGEGFSPKVTVTDQVETGNAVNIFHMIDQLTNGCLTYNPHEGDSAPKQRSLITDGTPVILYGISHGADFSVKAMQLLYGSPEDITKDYSGYNIRGVIQAEGVSSIKYVDYNENAATDLYPFCPAGWMLTGGIWRNEFYTKQLPDGSVLESAENWPGWLGVKAIHDGSLPDSEIETFNRVKGIKDIVMVMGPHGYTLLFDNSPYVTNKILEFCRELTTSEPQMNNDATTTLEEEVLKAPYVDLHTWYPSFLDDIILNATPGNGKVTLTWIAVSKVDVLGYHILCRQGESGSFEQINEELIAATGSPGILVNYEFVDDDVQNGKSYEYKLVEVGVDGTQKEHGSVEATPRFFLLDKK